MYKRTELFSEDQPGNEAVSEEYPDNKAIRMSPSVQLRPVPSQPIAGLTPSAPLPLGPDNTITTCNFCNSLIKTAVRYSCNTRTHIAAALWCTICCMCCIPYGCNSAKNTDHYCPGCNRYLGTYQR